MIKKTMTTMGTLVLVFVLILTLSNSTAVAANELEELLDEDLEIPTRLDDLIANFSLLEYQMITIENGDRTYDADYSFSHLGEEAVQGEQTDKIKMVIDTAGAAASEVTFWVGDEEIKQAEYQGEIIPGQMIDMMAGDLLDMVFVPFQEITDYNLEELASIGEVSKEDKMIGDNEVEVIKVIVEEIEHENIESGSVELANLDDLLMVVGFNFVSIVEDIESNFEVTNFERR